MYVLVVAAKKASVLWLGRNLSPEMQQDIFEVSSDILGLTEEGFLPWFCSRTSLHPPLAVEVAGEVVVGQEELRCSGAE